MTQKAQMAHGSEVEALTAKLHAFRRTLPQGERDLLDALMLASRGEQGEVQGYGFVPSLAKKVVAQYLDPANFDFDDGCVDPDLVQATRPGRE